MGFRRSPIRCMTEPASCPVPQRRLTGSLLVAAVRRGGIQTATAPSEITDAEVRSLDIGSLLVSSRGLCFRCAACGPARNHFQRGRCARKSGSSCTTSRPGHPPDCRFHRSLAEVAALLRRFSGQRSDARTASRAESAPSTFASSSPLHLPDLKAPLSG